MAEAHIGELAELYAIGALDEADRARVDAHVAVCPVCLRRVGEAEETLLALEAGVVTQVPPRRRELRLANAESKLATLVRVGAALAAGIAIGVLTMVPAYQRSREAQPALVAMVQSHFEHAPFVPVGNGTAPPAKAIYARDRSWLFIIVRGAKTYAVDAVSGSTSRQLGVLHPSGLTSTLFVDARVAEPTIELREGSRVVERASLR
jgi:hypothetical protein